MRLAIVESPYAGNVPANVAYLRLCIADCLARGDAPFASHGLYPGALDDNVPAERARGIEAGLAWARVADVSCVYVDRGISAGMRYGIMHAERHGRPIEWRSLVHGWLDRADAERLAAIGGYYADRGG